MNIFDQMLREHVTPVLAEAGFGKAGKTYSKSASTGDIAFVDFQRSGGSSGDRVLFFVNLSVVVTPHWHWLRHALPDSPAGEPDYSDGLWQDRVDAPAQVAGDEERWLFDGSGSACGPLLAEVLRDEVVPKLNRLLDRSEFLALSRDPARPLGPRVGPAELMLLIDEGPSPELEAEIARYEVLDPSDHPMAGPLAAWARVRLAKHS